MANIIGLTVARNVKAGVDVRELGVAAIENPLCFYGSDQLQSCHRKAMEALGLGNRALRRIATDAELRIDLAGAAQGHREGSCGWAFAGLRNRDGRHGKHRRHRRSAGARALSQRKRISGSMSMDASVRSSPSHRRMHTGSRASKSADSIALDPHKWLHAPFEAGCALIRDASAHRATFAVTPEYLGVGTPRPRIRRLAARIWSANHARIPGAQDLDGAKAARRREVRPSDRSEYRRRLTISAH